MKDPSLKLKQAIGRLVRKSSMNRQINVNTTPGCAFGAVEEQRLRNLEQQLDEIKNRVNGLLYTLVGAVVLEIVMRLI